MEPLPEQKNEEDQVALGIQEAVEQLSLAPGILTVPTLAKPVLTMPWLILESSVQGQLKSDP